MHDTPPILRREHFDTAGVALSFICGIHCLVVPIVLVMLPSLGWSIHANESYETIMVLLIIGLATMALVRGYLNHRRWQVIIFLVIGLVVFIFVRPALENSLHAYASVLGGSAFIVGHVYNWNWCRTCPVCRASIADCRVSFNKN